MFLSLWIGTVITAGFAGCSTPSPTAQPQLASAPPVEAQRSATSKSTAPSDSTRGNRNPDFTTIPKVPQPGAKITYSQAHVSGPYIAITFDDGPHRVNTPKLLGILRERNIKATWFVVGEMARENPGLIRQILAEGHEIGNHTMTHPLNITRLSPEKLDEEVGDTSKLLEQIAGYKPRLFRPPGGNTSPEIKQKLYDQYGLINILWSVDPNDWKRPGVSVVAHRLISGAHNGAILLCHDIHAPTIEAMPETLDTLLAKGYHFVTVSQLINMDQPVAAAAPASHPAPTPAPASGSNPAPSPAPAPAAAPPSGS
jgi:peptidoglycan/xylan/chitin deacetylase (PgdA/CDA1 family)